jgi:hypothetical protein
MSGYPTEKELSKLNKMCHPLGRKHVGRFSIPEIIEYIKELWSYKDRAVYEEDGDRWSLYLSTGGWSGNESVIREIEGTLFWVMYWQKSERGGHYWFEGSKGGWIG